MDDGQQRDGDARVGLVLAPRQHDAADDEQPGHGRGRQPAHRALSLEEQGEGAESEQETTGRQRRTPSGRGLPGLELVLHHVGHGLDDVVVDARGLIVDAGGDGEEAAVLDALDQQAGVVREPTTVPGDQAVAAVDRAGVEDADAARELGDELGDGHRTGEDEVDPARPRGDGHPHES